MYIYYITAAGNSNSLQLGSSCKGNRSGTEKAGFTTRPSHTKAHLPGHSPPACQAAAVLGQPSSLRPHWVVTIRKPRETCEPKSIIKERRKGCDFLCPTVKRMLLRENPYFCELYAKLQIFTWNESFVQQETNICNKKKHALST